MSRGLSRKAFEPLEEGEVYEPYVTPQESPSEFTYKAVIAGILFGILFGAANAYLGLKAGLDHLDLHPGGGHHGGRFRALARLAPQSSILEANISQTVGSASSSVASGVIFTLPALFLWGAPRLCCR